MLARIQRHGIGPTSAGAQLSTFSGMDDAIPSPDHIRRA